MIDIRVIVGEIVKAKGASDVAAFTVLTHGLVRQYGQELLVNLANAIVATSPEEAAAVKWLQERVVDVAKQIPGPKEAS